MQSRAFIIPKSLVQIQVGRVEVEVDISIMDRMAAVLNPTPLYIQSSTYSRDPLYSSFFSHPLVVSSNPDIFVHNLGLLCVK